MDETLFVYPHELPGNDYLENNKKIWKIMGYQIKTWREVFFKLKYPSLWKKDILILNFLENMPLYNPKFLKFVTALILLFVAKITTRKIVWVRHNFNPHEDSRNIYYKLLLKILDRVSDVKVAHRPVSKLKIDKVVQHPLYNLDLKVNGYRANSDKPIFIYFGVIKEYKGIPELVSKWPENVQLQIYGKCNDSVLLKRIFDIVANKSNITWRNEFLERDELDIVIAKADYVVIPHVDNSMIVSGAIFHSMSLGTNLLIKDSEFARWCVSVYPFVKIYGSDDIKSVANDLPKTNHNDLFMYVSKKNSLEVIKKEWNEVFNE